MGIAAEDTATFSSTDFTDSFWLLLLYTEEVEENRGCRSMNNE